MYIIKEWQPYSKQAPLSRVKVRGFIMAVYSEDAQPYSIEESEYEQAITKRWISVEEATNYLREQQRMNGI